MAKPSSKKNKGDDDELFPETGQKPPKKATKKVEKKTETKKVEKPENAEKAEKVETKKVETPATAAAPAKAPPAATPATPPLSKGAKLAVAGVTLVAIVLAALLLGPLLLNTGDAPERPKHIAVINNVHLDKPQLPVLKLEKPLPAQAPRTTLPPHAATPTLPLKPIAPAGSAPLPHKTTGKSAKELATRSANHGALARILELYDGVRKVDFKQDDRLFEDYQAKQRREKELLEQIRALGQPGIDALKDMIQNLDDDGYKILLAKALGGMGGPDALKAAGDLLANCHDIAVQTTLVRFLPDGPDATAIVAQAFSGEPNPNVRSMLLREYARRLGDGQPDPNDPNAQQAADASRAVFQQAALNDPDPNVRAEAVSIIGRRGDPRDMDLMAQIAKGEQNLQIRQSAIVAYATTGGDQSLAFLSDLAQHDDSLEIRASAVLAIARVGNDQAIQILDQIAQSDPREEIKSRASGFAAGLRARQQANQSERRAINTQPVPLERR